METPAKSQALKNSKNNIVTPQQEKKPKNYGREWQKQVRLNKLVVIQADEEALSYGVS